MRALLFAPRQIDSTADRIEPGALRDARYRAIVAALRTLGDVATPEALVAVLPSEAQEVVTTLVAEGPTGADAVRVIDDSLATLRVRELEDRQAEIDRLTVVASTTEKQELMMEKVRNRDEIRALDGRGYRTYGKSRQTAGRNDGAS